MSDGVFLQFLCRVFNFYGQKFFFLVNSPHYSNEDHVELDFPISLSM